jgi:glycosyltransferase involved in cell wall biosynthesis
MITTFYPPDSFGGDGIFVQNLAHALASRGHEVHVIYCRDSFRTLAGRHATESRKSFPNVTVHGLESSAGPLSPIATHQTGRPWFKMERIAAILDQGFDVIHYHNISLVGGPKLLEYGWAIKLYTTHDYWLVCPTSLLFQFGRRVCESRCCIRCGLAQRRPPQSWRSTGLLDQSVRHVDTFLSPSRFGIEMHRRLGFQAQMVHLPSFVHSETELPQEPPSGSPYFLFAGRLERMKGAHTLIEPFLRWGKARLVVAGAGADEAYLRALAGGSDRIEFRGHVFGKDLRTLYRGAVALIVPSLAFEVSPLVILEALREETPILVRNIGALPEAVNDSEGGLIYDTEQDLIAALNRLLAHPSYRSDLGRKGHRHYRSTWSEEPHLRRYFGIIENIRQHRSEEVMA